VYQVGAAPLARKAERSRIEFSSAVFQIAPEQVLRRRVLVHGVLDLAG
jgi:hypothetical protein